MCTIIFLDKIPLQFQNRIFIVGVGEGVPSGLDGDLGGP
jgi:hypothetical protein